MALVMVVIQPDHGNGGIVLSNTTLSRFLAEVRTRGGTPVPAELEPVGIILARIGMNPRSNRGALRKATLCWGVLGSKIWVPLLELE